MKSCAHVCRGLQNMIGIKTLGLFATSALLGASALSSPSHDFGADHTATWPAPTGELSIMSYNIKGLPWPVAIGREDAIFKIGQRLAKMRSRDTQPRVVVLQEAFGDAPHTLGRAAGYHFVVTGPRLSRRPTSPPLGQQFAQGAQWIKGEARGSVIDSGLAILSDHPVTRVERYAFPEGACAGYDCLAAKGVLVAWIDVPGAAEPIAFVDTHLNSRSAARVGTERADRAYAWQVAAVRTFLSRVLPPDTPVILGGDLNTGRVPARLAAAARPLMKGVQVDGLRAVLAKEAVAVGSQNEAQRIIGRNKDKIVFRDGGRIRLRPERAWVPFPVASQEPLSDHAGFVIALSLD